MRGIGRAGFESVDKLTAVKAFARSHGHGPTFVFSTMEGNDGRSTRPPDAQLLRRGCDDRVLAKPIPEFRFTHGGFEH
jgi:hypothetical protein